MKIQSEIVTHLSFEGEQEHFDFVNILELVNNRIRHPDYTESERALAITIIAGEKAAIEHLVKPFKDEAVDEYKRAHPPDEE